jgi:hypothetical protein
MKFPLYRKLSNNKRFYKIENIDCFSEIQIVGENIRSFQIEAKQFPEMNLIQDLIQLKEPYLPSNANEFESYEKQLKKR